MLLYSNSIADRLLACIIQNPSIVLDEKYNMGETFKNEFEIQLHKIIYVCIYNLYINGCQSITLMDLNEYLSPYESQYNIYKDNDGDNYIQTICELTDVENFDSYYNDFTKLSCLRYFYNKKCDISAFYDIDKNENEQIARMSNYSIDDIINYFDELNTEAKKKYYPKSKDIEETKAGFGLSDLKIKLQEEPLYGSSFCSELLNNVTRGMMDGQLSCFSSPTGSGKSTIAVATMCKVCARQIWDYENNQFIDNPNQTKNGGLYIQFELDNIQELSVKFLSCISGVPADIILDGQYTKEQSLRIDTAISILEESNIHLVYMPNFTQKLIDMSIKEHILKYDIDFVVYDYIQDGASLNSEMNKANGGIGMRTDQVLANLSDFLKQEARKYNIPIYTMTQTNSNLGTSEVIGVECISGSRALANKLDIGGVLLPIRPKEEKARDLIEQGLHEKGFGIPHANYIYHMYKVRFGKFPQNIKIWVNVDLGTGKMIDCFCTTWQNKLIKVDKVKLEKC